MSGPPTGRLRLTEHDRRRLRATRRIVLAGVAFGIVSAAGFALLGFDGRVGFALVLAGTALGAVVAALWTILFAIVDEARRDPVALARALLSIGLFGAGAFLLLVLVALAGADGSAGA